MINTNLALNMMNLNTILYEKCKKSFLKLVDPQPEWEPESLGHPCYHTATSCLLFVSRFFTSIKVLNFDQ